MTRFQRYCLYLMTGALAACSGGRAGLEEARIAPPDYVLGAEDVIEVTVWRNEALSRTVPVRPDGRISLPLLNDVQAAGLTPMQLRDVLAKRLTEFIPDPELSVIVQEVRSAKVFVYGEVTRPGSFELTGPARVLELLARAGGVTEFADTDDILLLRTMPEGTRRVRLSYDAMLSRSDEANVYLHPGDILVVR